MDLCLSNSKESRFLSTRMTYDNPASIPELSWIQIANGIYALKFACIFLDWQVSVALILDLLRKLGTLTYQINECALTLDVLRNAYCKDCFLLIINKCALISDLLRDACWRDCFFLIINSSPKFQIYGTTRLVNHHG